MNSSLKDVLQHFGIDGEAEPFGNGHINDTFVTVDEPKTVIQKINKSAFPRPDYVMENIVGVTEHIYNKVLAEGGDTSRCTIKMIKSTEGLYYYKNHDGEYYRAYHYIGGVKPDDGSIDLDRLYESARAFGNFQRLLADYPADTLHETITDFHNTPVRFCQLKSAIDNNKSGRLDSVKAEVEFALKREAECACVVEKIAEGKIPLRVTHNDTKLNNVLLDEETGVGVCVIDLDTVMPGSLLYDFGDALRFGGSTGAEDEPDLSKIWFDSTRFEAFAKGFLETLPSITEEEIKLLPFSVKLMTMECGIRFLADYINGDVYFKTRYPAHNLVRARTQFKLVEDIEGKMDELNAIVESILNNK